MRITTKGQVTIPIEIRERLGLTPETEVEFAVKGDAVQIKKASRPSGRGRKLIEHMKGKATVKMSTDEIMAQTRKR